MKTIALLATLAAAAALSTQVGCVQGNSNHDNTPKQATGLVYTDPTTGTFQLKKNVALSSPQHVVLDLVGTSTNQGCGVSLRFRTDATLATFANVNTGDPANTWIANGTVFSLGDGTRILKAKQTGNELQVVVAQKGLEGAKTLNGPLLRIALDYPTKANATVGTSVTLGVDANQCQMLLADGTLAPLPVAVGSLATQ